MQDGRIRKCLVDHARDHPVAGQLVHEEWLGACAPAGLCKISPADFAPVHALKSVERGFIEHVVGPVIHGISDCLREIPQLASGSYSRVISQNTFQQDRKSTRLNSSHPSISYAVFCLKKKKNKEKIKVIASKG